MEGKLIKKLKVEDIIKISKLDDDNFADLFTCEIGEWVQFLVQNVDNSNLFMVGVFEDDKLIGYLIAINAIMPPINNGISALYSKTAGLKNNKKALAEMIKWAKDKGATSIDLITNNVVGHAVYGFKKKATLMMMEI
jgi:hypothetical protein